MSVVQLKYIWNFRKLLAFFLTMILPIIHRKKKKKERKEEKNHYEAWRELSFSNSVRKTKEIFWKPLPLWGRKGIRAGQQAKPWPLTESKLLSPSEVLFSWHHFLKPNKSLEITWLIYSRGNKMRTWDFFFNVKQNKS